VTGPHELSTRRVGVVFGGCNSMNQASDDLARLRVNGLITRIPGRNRYRFTSDGLAFAIFYTKVHDRLLRPRLATNEPPAPPPYTKSIAHHRHSYHTPHRQGQAAAHSSLKLKTTLKVLAPFGVVLAGAGGSDGHRSVGSCAGCAASLP
jgi:hypothetical protein